jgi:putative Holliday junction resolvase
LALSDAGFAIASPLETLKRKKFTADAQTLKKLIDEHKVGGLVLGLPVNMDGTEGPRCQSTRQFAANLMEKFDIAIAFQDERLSTAAVERVLIGEADMTRKRRGEVVDKMAAAYILQGALDAMRHQGPR